MSKKVNFHDVQITYLMSGIPALKELHEGGNLSKITLAKAIESLESKGMQTEDLRVFFDSTFPVQKRGRSMPSAGEERKYKIQVDGTGQPFIKLPVSAFYNAPKGASCTVMFTDNSAIVKAPTKTRRRSKKT